MKTLLSYVLPKEIVAKMMRLMLMFAGIFTGMTGFFFHNSDPRKAILNGLDSWFVFIIVMIVIGAVSMFATVLVEGLIFARIEEVKLKKRILKKIYSKNPKVKERYIEHALSMENPSEEVLRAVIDVTEGGTPPNNEALDIILEMKKQQKGAED